MESTKFGAMISGTDDIAVLKLLGTDITREAIILDRFSISDKSLDKALDAGLKVTVNLNCSAVLKDAAGNKIPNPFITDMGLYRSLLAPVLERYGGHPQILCFVIENEPTNKSYHSGSMADYLKMLDVATRVIHRTGSPVASGCVHVELVVKSESTTEGNSGDVATLLAGYKNIDIDYVNMHTHGTGSIYKRGQMKAAADRVRKITGHQDIISDEWHCEGTDYSQLKSLMSNMMKQWIEAGALYSLYISGGSEKNSPLNVGLELTDIGKIFRLRVIG